MVDFGSEVKPHTIAVDDKDGKKMYFYLCSDGEYYNDAGTKLSEMYSDPGYCGVSPLETGKGDPYWINGTCPAHDHSFDLALAGYQDSTADNFQTFLTFTGNLIKGVGSGVVDIATLRDPLAGAYKIGTAPLYWLAGGVYGFFREEAESK